MKKSVYLSSLLALCCSLFAITARAQAPVISTDPIHDTTCNADTAWFHVAATGTAPLTFMWEFSTDGGTIWDTTEDGAVYLGTYNDTLTVIASTMMSGTMYRCQVMNADGADTSDMAMLTVETVAPAITGTTNVCKGSMTTLSNATPDGVWTNMHPGVATVSASGDVTGVDFGWDTVTYTINNSCGMSSSWASVRVDTVMVNAPITGPDEVCVGNMITLMNTNVLGSRVWSAGLTGNASVSASGVVTGLMGGLDTITYMITNACGSETSTMEVMVEVLPTAGTITGPSSVCAGSWIGLTSSITGGIWLSGTTGVAVVNSMGNVTGITMGTTSISYYQSNSCGASFASHIVTVDIPAGPITGNDSVGIDSTINLSNIVPGGMWTSSFDTVGTIDGSTGIFHGLDTGVTTIMYTVTNACGTTSSTLDMNVGPLPDAGTLTGADTVCVGATTTFTPSITGGTWVSRHDTIATVSDMGVVTGVEAGKDTVDYYVTTAFGRSRVTKRIYVNEPPVITLEAPAAIALGGSYTLIASPAGGTFTTTNSSMTPLVGFGFFVVIDTGTSIFTYTATNGCGTRSMKDTVHLAGASDVKTVGNNAAKLNIFPNPTQGALTIHISSDVNESIVLSLANMAGQKVQEYTISSNTDAKVIIDQPTGVYMLNAVTKDGNIHSARISVTR